jgi:hypothetical protein
MRCVSVVALCGLVTASCVLVTGAANLHVAAEPADATPDGGGDPTDAADEARPITADGEIASCSAEGLVAYWKMDEGSGKVAANCADSTNPAHLTDGVTWGQGRPGGHIALEFAGDDAGLPDAAVDEATVSTSGPLLIEGALTVALWLYLADTSSGGAIVGRGANFERASWGLVYGATKLTALMTDITKAAPVVLTARTDIPTKFVWHHVALVFRPGKALELWLDDGVPDDAGAGASPTAAATNTSVPKTLPDQGEIIIGRVEDSVTRYGLFQGRMQQLRIFTRALSGNEIVQLWSER